MAIFTALVTGLKTLKKVMDKKKQKEAAKKFVGGGKEEKRAKVSKILDEDGSVGEKSKVKKPASIDKSKLMKILFMMKWKNFYKVWIITNFSKRQI